MLRNALAYLLRMVNPNVISDLGFQDWQEAVGAQNLVTKISFVVFTHKMLIQVTTVFVNLKKNLSFVSFYNNSLKTGLIHFLGTKTGRSGVQYSDIFWRPKTGQ